MIAFNQVRAICSRPFGARLKADMNARDARGMTPIMFAASSAAADQFRRLLEARARLRPLVLALRTGHHLFDAFLTRG